MPITLNIEITSPLDNDDHDLLSGIAVMVLAIANRELARERFPEGFPDEEGPAPEPDPAFGVTDVVGFHIDTERPEPCSDLEMAPNAPFGTPTGKVCVSEVGHKGRHKYRGVSDFLPPAAVTEGMN